MLRLKASKASINKAIETIRSGGVVIFPTDTVYGIGAAVNAKQAVARIYKIKKRPEDKRLAVLISDTKQLKGLVEAVPAAAKILIKKHWPGALTLVFKRKNSLEKIGIRMPDHKAALAMIRACGPLAATSANLAGEKDPVSADEVKIEADLLLDGGACPIKEASTVVDVTGAKPVILRAGSVKPALQRHP